MNLNMQLQSPARDPVMAITAALASGGDIRLINPSLSLVSAVVDGTHTEAAGGHLSVVLPPALVGALDDRFPTAAQLADLASDGRAAVHSVPDAMDGTLVGGALVGVVYTRGETAALLTLETARWGRWVERAWETAVAASAPIDHDQVGYATLRATLADQLSSPIAASFDALVQAARRRRPTDAAIDPTAIALLATAWHAGQLAEVTRWGVDAGIASRSTFSRVKSQLADAGVLETTPIPQDVGRPRLRLELRPPHREQPDPDALIDAAGSVIG